MGLEKLNHLHVPFDAITYNGPTIVGRKKIRHEYDLLFACSNGTIDQTVDAAMNMARDVVHDAVDFIWYETMRRWREQNINQDLRNKP